MVDYTTELYLRIKKAYDEEDVEAFKLGLRDHPEYLRHEDGSDKWMWMAAQRGQLALIEALVEVGMDVNETSDHGDPNSPFYQPEGAIVEAASNGRVEVVRWLLNHGAKINYTVQGQPLIRASTNGHLDVVKLLVEHGADIHACWQGLNAVTQADQYGRDEVREYLRSLGARDLRETTPPDYAAAHDCFIEEMTDNLGPLGAWRQVIPGEPSVTIYVIPANEDCDCHTFFTVGLSDHRLPRPRKEFTAIELRVSLPSTWPLDELAMSDPETSWPVTQLCRVVEELRRANEFPSEPTFFERRSSCRTRWDNIHVCVDLDGIW